LRTIYNNGIMSKLAACYNRCIKTFFGFRRRESVRPTEILFNLGLPSFSTNLHNCKAIFFCVRGWAVQTVLFHTFGRLL